MIESLRRLLSCGIILCALGSAAYAQFVETTKVNIGTMGHGEWATQVLALPSGKEIVSAGVDGRIVFWDAVTGKNLREVQLPAIVLSLALPKDGKTLAAGDASGKVTLIDTDSGRVISSFTADKQIANAVAWSEDGKFVASGGGEGIVRIWSTVDHKISGEVSPGQGKIVSLGFANSQMVVGMIDSKKRQGSVEIWDWQNVKRARVFDEGTPAIRGLSISPDGKLLAISNFRKMSLLSVLPGENNVADISLRLLPDSDDPTPVAIWDLTNGKRVGLIMDENGSRSVAFSPDGKFLATAGPHGVMLHEAGNRTFAEIGRIDSRTAVDNVNFTSDSKQLLITRQREPLVKATSGGLDKLFDPYFTNVSMVVREGADSNFTLKSKAPSSLTGGSDIELWQIHPREKSHELKTWDAVQAIFNNKDEEARRILQQVIKDNPNYGEAQRLHAVLFEANDKQKVRNRLEAAVKSDPSCSACWRSLGDIQFGSGQYMDALKSYEHVIQLKPDYGLIAGRIAQTYGKIALDHISSGNNSKNMTAAEDALNRGLSFRPAEEQLFTNLGAVHYFRANFDKSIEYLLLAQKLRPDHARIYYNLGHSYRQKGDKKNALEAYRRYVSMGEDGEEARVERAKQLIAELSN